MILADLKSLNSPNALIDLDRPAEPAAAVAGTESEGGVAPHVSVVLPCYNEEAHVLLEIQRICAALDATEYP
ncbi:hypothetical protein ABH920_007527, partial [Catenulispora sp. EB89]